MMADSLRKLYLKVHNGCDEVLPTLHLIDMHANPAEILGFLITTGLTGRSLADFVHEKCKDEPIRFLSFVTKEILKVNTPPKLILGDNFR